MKVLIITPGYLAVPAINGGAVENLVDIIIQENEKYKRAMFTVIGVNDGINIDVSNFQNVCYKFVKNNTKWFKLKRFILALINMLPNVYVGNAYINAVTKILKKDKTKYDAVIIENNPLYILKVKKFFRCPVYLHLHNDYLNINSKLSKKVYSLYDGILTVSNFIGNRVKTIYGDNEKVKTLYNGIKLEKFSINISSAERKEIRSKYTLKDTDFVFLYTGRLIPEKGVKELIIAFNSACKKEKNLKLLIVGSSSYKNGKKSKYINDLENLMNSNSKNIIFTGYVDYVDIPKVYKSCDAQIVPSIWGEPLATTVIEGMASSLPLIVNNVGGIPEMVEKNCSLLCNSTNLINDLENNILKLYNERELRETLSKYAYKRASFFDKKRYYEDYIGLIDN